MIGFLPRAGTIWWSLMNPQISAQFWLYIWRRVGRTCLSFYPLCWKPAQLPPSSLWHPSIVSSKSRSWGRRQKEGRSPELLCALVIPLLSVWGHLCFLSSLPTASPRRRLGLLTKLSQAWKGHQGPPGRQLLLCVCTPQHPAPISMCYQPPEVGPRRPFLINVKIGNLVSGGPWKWLVLQ